MRDKGLIILLSIITISCGISYSVPRATLHIDLANSNDIGMVRDEISAFLLSKGFEDLGIDEEMLDLVEWSSRRHKNDAIAKFNSAEIDRIHRTRNLKNEDLEIDVMMIDYSDPAIKKRFVNYPTSETEITDSPSIELNIYNHRPGGFSAKAHEFYKELYAFIESKYKGPIHTIFSPPATDQTEFYKTSAINIFTAAVWWLLVYLITISLFGFIIIKILNRTKFSINLKRAIFALLGTILATPLPFPAATIFVIVLPSVLALPAIGSDYFSRVQEFAMPSFIVSAILCLLISIRLVKERPL